LRTTLGSDASVTCSRVSKLSTVRHHFSEDCEEKDRKIGAQFDKDKERKRQKAYAAKKAKKRAEWESQLRAKTGIEGYEVSAPDWVGLE
jgi:hypothetical protein